MSDKLPYLPINIAVAGRDCLLVGGGDIALRKARLLLKAEARIHVVSPDIVSELAELLSANNGRHSERAYTSDDCKGNVLIIAATADDAVNAQVAKDAGLKGIPVNVVDNPALCTFVMPAIVDRAPLSIAISSGGAAPVLARQVREKIEQLLPANLGRLAVFAKNWRHRVNKEVGSDKRRYIWEAFFRSNAASKLLAGDEKIAEQTMEDLLQGAESQQGEVYLVGAGPGDPDLLALKALRLMQEADIVFYDRLVSDAVMEKLRRDADRVYVGKAKADHAVPQERINHLLLEHAQLGKKVLRLKGGDPFIFGRGAEELDLLAEHNIPVQVVPGITAASGCASYAGIPLTHRDYAQSVRFITGHLKDGNINLPWPELVQTGQTLVFYMGLTGVEYICEHLIKNGRDPATPAALVEKGTLPQQRVVAATLENLPEMVRESGVRPPTLIIIGEVVLLHNKLRWFEG
jgi:uroporphyrin-III C-methyltransferase/precorrin-2 dehydrogenase/sirohydrochlorin ferrochelatase